MPPYFSSREGSSLRTQFGNNRPSEPIQDKSIGTSGTTQPSSLLGSETLSEQNFDSDEGLHDIKYPGNEDERTHADLTHAQHPHGPRVGAPRITHLTHAQGLDSQIHATALTIESLDESQDGFEETPLSLFPNPRNFTIQDSRFTAHHTTNHITHASGTTALDILLSSAAHSATYNSMDRSFDTPKCDEDTRVGLIEEIMNWAQGEEVPSRLLCLTGSAGSGKSALAQTTSEICAKDGCLGASFFFSITDVQRNNADRFVASLAYQLSRSMIASEQHILRAVGKDPAIFKMSMKAQAEVLVINPVLNAARGSESETLWVIVVDGLDECRGEHHQAQVLQVLQSFVDANLPFRIFITSRPEYAMRSALSPTGHLNGAYHIVLNEHDATKDIRLYLRRRLGEIGRARGDNHWPSEVVLDILVNNATGQFIYAVTVVKFVGDRRCSPFRRLQVIIDWDSNPINKRTQKPFVSLDALYMNIVLTAQVAYQESYEGKGECPRLIQRLLGFMVITDLCTIENKAFIDRSAIECALEWEEGECNRLIEDLYSVAHVKPSPFRDEFRISFYHKSFLDFLRDPGRSQSFYVSPEVLFADLTARALNHVIAVDLDHIPAGWTQFRIGAADDRLYWSKLSLDVALLTWPRLLTLALRIDPKEPVYSQICDSVVLLSAGGAWDKLAKIARAGFKSAGNSKGLKHLLSTSEFNVRHCPILELCKSYPTEPETPADSAVSVLEEAAEDAFSERSNIPTPRLFNSLRQQMEEQEAPEVLEPEPEPEQEQEQEQEPPSRPKIPRIRIKALYSRFITYLWQRGIRT